MENKVENPATGVIKEEKALSSVRVGQKAMISAIKSCPAELLHKLVSMGIVAGS